MDTMRNIRLDMMETTYWVRAIKGKVSKNVLFLSDMAGGLSWGYRYVYRAKGVNGDVNGEGIASDEWLCFCCVCERVCGW